MMIQKSTNLPPNPSKRLTSGSLCDHKKVASARKRASQNLLMNEIDIFLGD
jgi:hypothetical protein